MSFCWHLLKKSQYDLNKVSNPAFIHSPAFSVTVISGRLPARPITRTGRLLHTAKKKVNRLPALVDNPHVVIQLFGGENVTLR